MAQDKKALKVKAAVFRKMGGPLKIEPLEMEGTRDDEVLVRIVASGICHTDIAFVYEWGLDDGPVILGHEGAGVVEQTGKKVKKVKPGDHVVLSYLSCGKRKQCRSGHPADCEQFWEANFGFSRLDGSKKNPKPLLNVLRPSIMLKSSLFSACIG